MIERLIDLSIRHRVATIVVACGLAICGVIAVGRTPMDAIPDLSENQVLVFTDWPGHNPREIDEQLTSPLSRHLQGIDGVRVVRGASEPGFSLLHLIFEDDVRFEAARRRVQERLTLLSEALPRGVTPRLAPDAVPTGQIFWYTIESSGLDLGQLRDIQDWYLRPQLSSVAGVAEVASVGGHVREFVVELDLEKLSTLGITPRDVCDAVEQSQAILGGNVIHKGNAEFLVHVPGGFGAAGGDVIREIEAVLLPVAHAARVRAEQVTSTRAGEPAGVSPRTDTPGLSPVRGPTPSDSPLTKRLRDIARVTMGPKPRRGVFEKDGNEVIGGVIAMRYGHNPLEVTRAIRRKLTELRAGLPHGVRVVPCYDRTPLIEGAVATVTGTVLEAMLGATLCVLLVLRHLRSSFVIAITLPLAALTSFAIMAGLRWLGIVDIQTNIMSLSGIAISIGVLVDSSIVMAENAMTHLRREFGDRPVSGDVREIVRAACHTVGQPIFFSVLIMLISFLPVFALGGIDGKLFRPLAYTKTFALIAVAILSVTLVPALCTIFLRGRMRAETESWLVHSVMEVYRPVLNYLLDHPALMAWIISVTLLLGVTPIGNETLFRTVLFAALVTVGWIAVSSIESRMSQRTVDVSPPVETLASVVPQTRRLIPPPVRQSWRPLACASGLCGTLVVVALIAQQTMRPLGIDLRVPLDEGMVMDMPITVPRISVTQAADDLKARNMLLCRFPEVSMVVGKAGRAETPFDPAPLDMIETMVDFRPAEFWPKRKLRRADAERQAQAVAKSLVAAKLVADVGQTRDASTTAQARCELGLREYAYVRNQEFERQLSRRLIHEALTRLAKRWYDEGRLVRKMQSGDLAWMQDSLSPHLGSHLSMSLEEDDLRTIAEHAWGQLIESELVAESADGVTNSFSGMNWLRRTVADLLGRKPVNEFAELRSQLRPVHRAAWGDHVQGLNRELFDRGTRSLTQLVAEELCARADEVDSRVETWLEQIAAARQFVLPPLIGAVDSETNNHLKGELRTEKTEHHHAGRNLPPLPVIDPVPELDALIAEQTARFAKSTFLWAFERDELAGFGGELDRALQMPGWTNVWTRPIQNRVDMLATGINTEIGVRVLGSDLDAVVRSSEEIAAVLRGVSGAADVIADPIRGKGYLEIVPNRELAAELGVDSRDLWAVIETALGGKVVATVLSGGERHDVRIRANRDAGRDEIAVRQLKVPCVARFHSPRGSDESDAPRRDREASVDNDESGNDAERRSGRSHAERGNEEASSLRHVMLGDIADVRIAEGPATVKRENGLLRNYVRLNVRGRGTFEFLADAKRAVAENIELPQGTFIEWTGQFEHAEQTGRTLLLITPVVIGLILLILWLTYRDWADTFLMLLAVPGAIAGGVFFQWLFGYRWSVPVAVGYLACFGMATSTSIIMLVYLREALEKRGPLASLAEGDLRAAVIEGAVHRLRPKLLTEGTTILGLAPMLWASGVGAEVIRPMAAPVLGGILIADEVIDLLLPVLFYWVRRHRWQVQQRTSPNGDGSTTLPFIQSERNLESCSVL